MCTLFVNLYVLLTWRPHLVYMGAPYIFHIYMIRCGWFGRLWCSSNIGIKCHCENIHSSIDSSRTVPSTINVNDWRLVASDRWIITLLRRTKSSRAGAGRRRCRMTEVSTCQHQNQSEAVQLAALCVENTRATVTPSDGVYVNNTENIVDRKFIK